MTPSEDYRVDICFCLDSSNASKRPFLKRFLLEFPSDVARKFANKDKHVSQVRARIITFGHDQADIHRIAGNEFQSLLPDINSAEFAREVFRLNTGDEPTDVTQALGALELAINSNWVQEGHRQRHIIVLFADTSAHPLEVGVGPDANANSSRLAARIGDLTDVWQGRQLDACSAIQIKPRARRLLLFAPDVDPWNTIGDAWEQTVFLPSKAGDGLSEVEYDTILEVVVNAV